MVYRPVSSSFAVAAAGAVLMLASSWARGQEPPSTTVWTPSTTAWGDPDLQGLWNNGTTTPLERPDELAGQEFLTADEVAERDDAVFRTRNTDRDPQQGDPGTYNDHGEIRAFFRDPDGHLFELSELVS